MGFVSNLFNESAFEQLIDGIPISLFMTNHEGNLLFANVTFINNLKTYDNHLESDNLFDYVSKEEFIDLKNTLSTKTRLDGQEISIKGEKYKFNVLKAMLKNKEIYIFSRDSRDSQIMEEINLLESYMKQIINLGNTTQFNDSLITQSFVNLSYLINENKNIRTILLEIAKKVSTLLKAKGAIIWMKSIDKLLVCGQYGLKENYVKTGKLNLSVGSGITGKHFNVKEIKLISDLDTNPDLFYSNFPKDEGVNHMIIIPLRLKNKNIGLINIFNNKINRLSSTDEIMLNSYGTIAASMLRNVLLIEEFKNLKDNYEEMISESLNSPEQSFFKPLGATVNHEMKNMLNNFKYQFEDILFDTQTMNKFNANRRNRIYAIAKTLDTNIKVTKKLSELLAYKDAEIIDTINVKKMVQNAVTFLLPKINDSSIEINIENVNENINIIGSMMELLLVMFNIINNSIKAINKMERDSEIKGHINIRANKHEDKNEIFIEIEDDGVGIKNEIYNDIWDAGFTTEQDGNSKSSGVGLFGCKRIIENMDGIISVSSSVGKGATFKIELPL